MLGIDMLYYICSIYIMVIPRLYMHDKLATAKILSSFDFLQTYPNLLASPKEGESSKKSKLFLKIGAASKKKKKR